MKRAQLFAAFAIATACLVVSASASSQTRTIQGDVAEVQNASGYTYLRIKTKAGEAWAAVPQADVKVGARVSVESSMAMENFESKSLKRKFDTIAFGVLVDSNAKPSAAAPAAHATAAAPAGHPPVAAASAPVVKVAKATGPEARTVAEVVTGKGALKDKTVLVRGQVVKLNAGILGKNWLHLQDGSGSAADSSNDILVTSKEQAAVGEVVTVRGTVRTDVNLGAGYAYPVIIEDAALRR